MNNKRVTLRVTFSHGDLVVTGFNGTLEEAEAYYLTNWFNFGDTEAHPRDLMAQGVKVEEI